MNKQREKSLRILNTAYEAVKQPELHDSIIKLYEQLPELYDRYASKVPASDYAGIRERCDLKSMNDLEHITGVYLANANRDKLCSDKFFPLINRAVERILQPYAQLLRPYLGSFSMMDEIEDSLIEISQSALADICFNLEFYIEIQGDRPKSDDPATDIAIREICNNLPDQGQYYFIAARADDIRGYKPDSSYYDEFIAAVKEVFIQNFDSIVMSRAKYIAYSTNSYKGIYEIREMAQEAKSAYSRALLSSKNFEDLKHTAIKDDNLRPEKLFKTTSINPIKDYFDCCENETEYYMLYEIIKSIYYYHLKNIDIIQVIKNSKCRKPKWILQIANESFYSVEADDISTSDNEGKHAYVKQFINDLFMAFLLDERSNRLKTVEKHAKAAGSSKQKASQNKELLTKIAMLENKNADLSAAVDRMAKKEKQQEKLYLAEIHDLTEEINRLHDTYEKDEIEEIGNEQDYLESESREPNNDENDITNDPTMTEDEFREFVTKYNILFWGLRPSVRRRMQEMFPEMDYVASDKELTNTILKNYDGILLKADYTSHTKYYRLKNMTRNLNIPFICLDGNWMSPVHLYREAVKLEEAIKNQSTTK